jgi:hypothetical protein
LDRHRRLHLSIAIPASERAALSQIPTADVLTNKAQFALYSEWVMFTAKHLLALVCATATACSLAAATTLGPQNFDPSRGVVLSGPEAQSVAAACGGTSKSAAWRLDYLDIEQVERKLAPLLAADLENGGSASTVRQYYRQYATGRLGTRRAIFVNGFHERYVAFDAGKADWHRTAVDVTDGGDSYWCAVYIKETGEFIQFKSHGLYTHVWFRGLA